MKTVYNHLGCLAVFMLIWIPTAYGQGDITGTVQMKLKNGEIAYADRVRVLLTTAWVAVPFQPDLSAMNDYERMEFIRNLHMDFFIKVREEMGQAGYLANDTLTDQEGIFRFTDVPPGTYYIVIAFPAMIESYKVAWQIPIDIKQGEGVKISLNRANMAMPTYIRGRE